jgi:DNA-binding NtrC family response regulator
MPSPLIPDSVPAEERSRPRLARRDAPLTTVARAPSTLEAMRLLRLYAPGSDPVVLVGGTGTGKTHAGELLHELSGRRGRFCTRTAWELHPDRAEDTLFGHTVGGFTDAKRPRDGVLTLARDGTFLFDDFHLARKDVQYLLLRVFDRGTYAAVGSDRDIELTARLVVAMREHPDRLVARGRLLRDLRYRLGYCIVVLASLVERREEIGPLAERFLAECRAEAGEEGPVGFAPGVVEMLEIGAYDGNLRQLRGFVRAAFLHARGCEAVTVEHLPRQAVRPLAWSRNLAPAEKKALAAWAVWKSGGRIAEAAERIGVHRNTLGALAARSRRQPPM